MRSEAAPQLAPGATVSERPQAAFREWQYWVTTGRLAGCLFVRALFNYQAVVSTTQN